MRGATKAGSAFQWTVNATGRIVAPDERLIGIYSTLVFPIAALVAIVLYQVLGGRRAGA